jgi:hypothetical protein
VETRGTDELHAVFFKGKPHTWSLPAARGRKSGSGRDDKGRGVALVRVVSSGGETAGPVPLTNVLSVPLTNDGWPISAWFWQMWDSGDLDPDRAGCHVRIGWREVSNPIASPSSFPKAKRPGQTPGPFCEKKSTAKGNEPKPEYLLPARPTAPGW